MNQEEKFEWIERYWKGQMPDNERLELESRMANDPDFRAEAQLHFEIMEALSEKNVFDLRENLNAARDKFRQSESENFQPKNKGRRWLAWLLLLPVLGLLAWLFFQKPNAENTTPNPPAEPLPPAKTEVAAEPQKTSPEISPKNKNLEKTPGPKTDFTRLAVSFYQKPQIGGGLKSSGEANSSNLEMAEMAFSENRFQAAADLLKNTRPDDEESLRLRGHAQFNLKNFDFAAADFRGLSGSFQFKKEAEWLLALCAVGAGKPAETRVRLDEILKNSEHPFFEPAKRLRRELERY